MTLVLLSKCLKRLIDLIISLIMLILLSPLFLIVAVLVWRREGRPIFHTSFRYITPEQQIRVYKFRTMVKNSGDPQYQLVEKYMREGFMDIPLDSPVYTPIGRILERTQMVETLQFLNVLLGQMSIVGNRPLPELNMRYLRQKTGWRQRLQSPAGMTGISQVVGKYDLTPDERLHLESLYSRVYNEGHIVFCDLYILYRTAVLLLTGKGLPFKEAERFLLKCLIV
jgi:lipopolysaccharide/colanic/teichoic acid biosynthesis glycosyltransferase